MKRVDFSYWCQKATGVAFLAVVGGLAAWALSSASVAQSSAGQVRTAATRIDRAPNWVNEMDPHETFAGQVAVSVVNNEIVVQSPGKVFVYDRLANTPPRGYVDGTQAPDRRTRYPTGRHLWSLCGPEDRRDLQPSQRHFQRYDRL